MSPFFLETFPNVGSVRFGPFPGAVVRLGSDPGRTDLALPPELGIAEVHAEIRRDGDHFTLAAMPGCALVFWPKDGGQELVEGPRNIGWDDGFSLPDAKGPGFYLRQDRRARAHSQTQSAPPGTHRYAPDPRNDDIYVYVNGGLLPRAQATVSVFDSGFVMGDGVWETLRVDGGRVAFLDRHLDRLFEGAAAIDLDIGLTRDEVVEALSRTVRANGAPPHLHVRLMITRGIRATPYQDPRVVLGGPTVVIVPEVKQPAPGTAERALKLFTVHVRRGRPDVQDPGLNTHSKLNCITACIQATKAGADEALMLDPQGFVATCNSTHFFVVRDGEVWTSTGDYCLPGITRANVIRLCRENGIPCFERNFSLSRVYGASEAFCTGTFAGLAPVGSVDGRTIGTGIRGPVTARLQELYRALVEAEAQELG